MVFVGEPAVLEHWECGLRWMSFYVIAATSTELERMLIAFCTTQWGVTFSQVVWLIGC